MVWLSLGTKQPGFEWEQFTVPVVGDAALRISQSFQPAELAFINKIHLGEFYPNGGHRFLTVVYPDTLPKLESFAVPPAFAQAGYALRNFAVKHNAYGVAAVANWTITLEVWIPDGEATQIIDGGIYDGV